MKLNKLTKEEERVIVNKGTEAPFSGEYDNFYEPGVYVCRRCDTPLYNSKDKFDAHCGWPAFDQEIEGRVKNIPDTDGLRTEIICNTCKAHLGHVFLGENMTPKNTRFCVNSVSLRFVPSVQTIVLAGGCFWCTEAVFLGIKGVLEVTPGYSGGYIENPTYEQVSTGKTGHAEAIKVEYNPEILDFNDLLDVFFGSHDATTLNRQGNDTGEQYRSAIFYTTNQQKEISEEYIKKLDEKKVFKNKIVTQVKPFKNFYKAEDYHKRYYEDHKNAPYCQVIISPKLAKVREKFKNLLK